MNRLMSKAIVLILLVATLAAGRPVSKQLSAINLGTLPGGRFSVAKGINDQGR